MNNYCRLYGEVEELVVSKKPKVWNEAVEKLNKFQRKPEDAFCFWKFFFVIRMYVTLGEFLFC